MKRPFNDLINPARSDRRFYILTFGISNNITRQMIASMQSDTLKPPAVGVQGPARSGWSKKGVIRQQGSELINGNGSVHLPRPRHLQDDMHANSGNHYLVGETRWCHSSRVTGLSTTVWGCDSKSDLKGQAKLVH